MDRWFPRKVKCQGILLLLSGGVLMGRLGHLNLIVFFEFYLATAFVLSTASRLRQYLAVLGLVAQACPCAGRGCFGCWRSTMVCS